MIPFWEHGRIITTEEIIAATEQVFDVCFTGKNGFKRSKRISEARAVAMVLTKELLKFSLPEVAERFGLADHTSVFYAQKRLQSSIELQRDMHRVKTFMRV